MHRSAVGGLAQVNRTGAITGTISNIDAAWNCIHCSVHGSVPAAHMLKVKKGPNPIWSHGGCAGLWGLGTDHCLGCSGRCRDLSRARLDTWVHPLLQLCSSSCKHS